MQAARTCLPTVQPKPDSNLLRKQKQDWRRMCRKNSSTRRRSMPILPIFLSRIPKSPTRSKDAEDKDWNQEWEEQGFEPIYVDDQVVIYDAKHPELYPIRATDPTIIEIGIEAKLAFGTGNHETTRMIISSLLHMTYQDQAHSGLRIRVRAFLGLTCSKLGAKDVVGYDIDEWSVENAKHNAVLNGVD